MNVERERRLLHIKKHLANGFDVDKLVMYVQQGMGSPINCVGLLSSHAFANGMHSWFAINDLQAIKNWFYVAACLDRKYYQMEVNTHSPGPNTYQLLKPLISGNQLIIDWFLNYDLCYDSKRIENCKTGDFWAYQAIVALRGDWKRLKDRCDHVIANPPGASSQKKYLIDHQFYLALANHDVPAMENVLRFLVTPKALKSRRNDEGGYTEDLISTPAVIYAKIAWLHGFEVVVNSPFIPPEWLPNEPLAQYDPIYSFLK